MIDPFVILTPVVVLLVLLLLGFAGCDVVFGLEPPPDTLKLEVRVSSRLVVDVARFRYTPPTGTGDVTESLLERADEGPDVVVLSHLIPAPPKGMWTVVCRLDVKDGAGAASDSAPSMFTLDDTTPGAAVARFEATGSPATNDFRVRFAGLVAET